MLIVYRPFIMKLIISIAMLATAAFFDCASAATGAPAATTTNPAAGNRPTKVDGPDGTSTLVVGPGDDPRYILETVPVESAMERLELIGPDGRKIYYVALTDTDVGGVVFVDTKLLGTVSRHDAQSFYSCRGYASTAQAHWVEDASDWTNALLAATTPASTVTLHFSGKSTPQSIKEVASNTLLSQLSLFDLSTNPLSLLRKLNSAHDNMREREKYEKTLQSLQAITTGTIEEKVNAVLTPEDVFFGDNGLVLSYPRFAIEYYVSAGIVKISQQPSFHRIAHAKPALFYVPNAKWDLCNPKDWRSAIPPLKAPTP